MTSELDPQRWLDEHGDSLYRYALLRLRNPEAAEDAVQETLVAAFHARERFTGKSSVRTWLIGILKHKIIDSIRKAARERPVSELNEEDRETAERLFDEQGHWRSSAAPSDWGAGPREALERKEFMQALEQCMSKLPERLAAVFALRELEQMETEEICNVLSISPTNLWVMLHRARLRLRECLEVNWFGRRDS